MEPILSLPGSRNLSQRTPQLTTLKSSRTLPAAWALILLMSALPDIVLEWTSGRAPSWLFASKNALLVLFIGAGFAWRQLAALRECAGVFLILSATQLAVRAVSQSTLWSHWMTGSFGKWMLGSQLLNCGGAIIMIAALLVRKRRRSEIFLIAGREGAEAEPVWWFWTRRPVAWSWFGPVLSLCIGGGLLVFLTLAGKPSLLSVSKLPVVFPAVCLFAAMNAFGEEVSYRVSLLATLRGVVSDRQAIWMTAAWFGLAHYHGVPYGVIGVVMAGWLGLVLGKAMLETSGLFWPWFIHFVQDVLVFSFLALGAVSPGGTGSSAPAQPPSAAIVSVQPETLVAGRDATITYTAANGPIADSSKLSLHHGLNGWSQTETTPMIAEGQNVWTLTIHLPADARQLDFVFTDGSRWDNNGGRDWHVSTR